MSFRFLCLGVGDAFSERWYGSSLALHAEGKWLLLDCPHPIHKALREAAESAGIALSAEDLAGLLLTHLHADHSSGIEGLAFKTHFYYRRKLPLLCHPLVAERLWEGHLAGGMETLLPSEDSAPVEKALNDYIDLQLLDDSAPTPFGPFSIECRRTIHHIPTFAMRITASNRRLGWSSDTTFDPSLLEWLSDSDLIIHETNVGLHTPYEKLAELPESLRAKMRLIHYPDSFNVPASVIKCLQPGRLYEVAAD
jgi:ribonuclease BN (tRNA processing enzyme)